MKYSKRILLLFLSIFSSSLTFSATFYVAPNGNDSNNGTISAPFLTIQRAQDTVFAGDTVYVRGGDYQMTEAQIAKVYSAWAYVTYLDKSGTAGHLINYWAYPSEHPVFHYDQIKPANLRVNAFQVNGSYIHLKGLEVTGVQVTITTHTQSECFENQGSHNIYEQLKMHDGQAIGFYLTKGSDNLILNCDAYNNHDYTSENKLGGNTDGFGCHPSSASYTNNVFRGCRAWFNSDDGYDCINAHASTTFDHCWSFYNGYSTTFQSLGDGNGFKAGGYGNTTLDKLPTVIPHNTVQFCLAVKNKANGFYSNHHLAGSYWYNNTAYQNGNNFNMLNRKAANADDYLTDVSGYDHVMKNNLSLSPRGRDTTSLNAARCDISYNSFTLPVTVSADDFKSLDLNLLTQARNEDGSLPDIDLLKLVAGSDLIDAGKDIGFAYAGAHPDLGYQESGNITTAIKPEKTKEEAQLYPNPVKEFLNIDIKNAKPFEVAVYALDGKLMMQKNYQNQAQVKLDVSDLKRGLYVLELKSNQQVIRKKVVKK